MGLMLQPVPKAQQLMEHEPAAEVSVVQESW